LSRKAFAERSSEPQYVQRYLISMLN
jgi:hypothetical protein